jgi:hypothetical protein
MTILAKFLRRPRKKDVSLHRRHLASTALMRCNLKRIADMMEVASKVYASLHGKKKEKKRRKMKLLLLKLVVEFHAIDCVPRELFGKLKRVAHTSVTLDDFDDQEIPTFFRFNTKQQLRELIAGFQFPEMMISTSGHKFTGQEVALVGLYRLHRPTTLADACWGARFRLDYDGVGKCFKLFLRHLVDHWQYLITDNVVFWKPYLAGFAESIRNKCASKGVDFPRGFRVFGFIDNTMNATCRPGGGPARDGTYAPRNDPLIQRAWYNGWKKLHGMKWQTVDLPNGMNFHVWGPISIRHPDCTSLEESHINDLMMNLQVGDEMQYAIYGDSAYIFVPDSHVLARHNNNPNSPQHIAENRILSSCRETIEWDYGDVGTMWALVDYKKVLKMRKMPVRDMYMTAMLLRNAYVTMKGCTTCEYFNCIPPTFQTWIRAGPR